MRAIVLGSKSFLDNDGKLGIQFIAEGLARNGWQVDYISNASSILDSFSASRRSRFRRIWLERQDKHGFEISSNLKEYAFMAPFPTRKEVLRTDWQIKMYPSMAPKHFFESEYDVCIHDSSNTFLFLPKIKAKYFIYRLNDLPSGFSFAIHSKLINTFERTIASGKYDEIWAVSEPLAEYAYSLNKSSEIEFMPNGVDIGADDEYAKGEHVPKTAVFVGNIFPWIDMKLVNDSALLLPDWSIDFYGPLHTDWNIRSKNIHYKGVLERARVAETLRKYSVGLIPFQDISGRMDTVERPLKFFEYISARLGVAATDVGSLRHGMGQWATYGKTPKEYSDAIIRASDSASMRENMEIKEFLEKNSWNYITKAVLARLDSLLGGRKGDTFLLNPAKRQSPLTAN